MVERDKNREIAISVFLVRASRILTPTGERSKLISKLFFLEPGEHKAVCQLGKPSILSISNPPEPPVVIGFYVRS